MRRWDVNNSLIVRRWLQWTAAALAALLVIAAVLAAALDAGYFRDPLIRFLSARTGRQIQVQGSLEVQLFSLKPRMTAERVTIGNPAWMPAGPTAEIGMLLLVFDMPRFGHLFGVERLEIQAATLHLVRDSTGHANWQWTDPAKGNGASLPIVRSLSMPNARVMLADGLRHLQFAGTVSAQDVNGAAGLQPLRIDGAGQLNGRAASFEIMGDPLASASHGRPYRFTFAERSSGSRLSGRGLLLRPFDFDALDTTFDASGADLKDLYFLTGVTLVNTGSYRLSGKLARRGTNTQFSDLAASSGQSDMHGTASIETSSGRPKFTADFASTILRLSDLGVRAAARDSAAETSTPLLLSNAMLTPSAVRRGDAVVNFHARRVEVGRVALHAVSADMTIDHGILAVAPLLADVLQGKLTAHLRLDATTDLPTADVDLKIGDLQLAQIDRKGTGQPPIEGPLQVRVAIAGRGSSLHQVAASANGTVTAVLPHGAIRASLAELTGIDLRGLGLLLAKNTQETPVRCGVASFKAREGTLTAQSLVLDTDRVLIVGDGQIHLRTEAIDLTVRGHPKALRLFRLRSPVFVRGTLAHPSIDIQSHDSAAQTAETALGVVLSPLAAVLTFVDPDLAKDADCAALLAAAKPQDAPESSALHRPLPPSAK